MWAISVEQLGPDLAFRPSDDNPTGHGYIELAYIMPFERYDAALKPPAGAGKLWYHEAATRMTLRAMTPLAETYDRALQAALAPSTRMALYLRSVIRDDLDRGKVTREAAFAALEALYDQYGAQGRWDERNAVGDVMDSFVGWSPSGANL